MGNDLGGAFWPMAKRSLEWTYFLRENRSLIFAFSYLLFLFHITDLKILVSMKKSYR